MSSKTFQDQKGKIEIAKKIKQACIDAAREGYQTAAMSGLCCEGAWEAAVSAMQMLDVETILGTEN